MSDVKDMEQEEAQHRKKGTSDCCHTVCIVVFVRVHAFLCPCHAYNTVHLYVTRQCILQSNPAKVHHRPCGTSYQTSKLTLPGHSRRQ